MPAISIDEFNALIGEELPWASELNMRATEIGEGTATLVVPFADKMLRPGGTILGPMQMFLADACMYAVLLSKIGPVKLAVTTNLNTNFLRKPAQADLIAKGEIIKLGKRLAIMSVDVMSAGSDDLVAHVTGTYSIPPR